MYQITSQFIRAAFAFGTLLLMSAVGHASPQQSTSLAPNAIIAKLSGEQVSLVEYDEALRGLTLLSQEEQSNVLQAVLEQAHTDEAASMAAAMLINLGVSGGAMDAIASKIGNWPDQHQRSVLHALIFKENETSTLVIPRAVLQHVVDTGAPAHADDLANRAIDLAAYLLGRQHLPADLELMKQAVQVVPSSRGLWSALAGNTAIDPQVLALAVATFVDEDLPLLVRVAAAVAAAPENEQAKEFAVNRIGAFLSEFGQRDAEAMVAQAMSGDAAARDEYLNEFRPQQQLIAMIGSLQTDNAQQLIAAALGAQNSVIKMIAATVAIERWPDMVASMERGSLSVQEFALLKVKLAQEYPEYLESVQQELPEALRHQAETRLERDGWFAANPLAGVASGF